MTDERPGPRSPADEQRTTALPRPTGAPTPASGPQPGRTPEPPSQTPGDDTPSYETTVLRRPAGDSPIAPSNLPGAVRPPVPPAPTPGPTGWQAPGPPSPDPRSRAAPYRDDTAGWEPDRGSRAVDPRARRDYPRAGRTPEEAPDPGRGYREDDPRDRPPAGGRGRRRRPPAGTEYLDDDDDFDDDLPYEARYRYQDDPEGLDDRYRQDPYRDRRDRRDEWGGHPDDRDPREVRHRPGDRAGGGRAATSPRLPPYREPPELAEDPDADQPAPRGLPRAPRKLTVTRVAALRSRELTHRGMEKFHGAVIADGADRSGLGHLTYAVMANYAVDAAVAVALANTLFFAAAKADSAGKVLLYLLLTVAPFAVIAPLIGPLLDRLQNGRRIALAASSFGRAALAVVMAIKFDSWVIYPCALGMLVLSKSFGVLKAALTPRVLPEQITLVKTNSRLTVFGLIAGGVSGAIAAGITTLTSSAGALGFTAACGVVGGWLCLRIPAWVESTEGEVPVEQRRREPQRPGDRTRRRVLPRPVAGALWAAATIRVETGFLALFIAFVVKSHYQPSSVVGTPGLAPPPPTSNEGFMQLLLLGAIGAVAGLGGFVGNALGARLPLRAPQTVALACLCTVIASVLVAFLVPGLVTAGAVAFVGSTASSLAKVCLDSTIQHQLPEVSRASAFGRSESVLQLTWVFGGVIGLLIGGVWVLHGDSVYLVGFGIVGLLLLAGLAQCLAMRLGRTLVPRVSLRALLHLGRAQSTGAPSTGAPSTTGTPGYRPAGEPGYRPADGPEYGPVAGGGIAPGAPSQRPARPGSQQAARPASGRGTRRAGRPR